MWWIIWNVSSVADMTATRRASVGGRRGSTLKAAAHAVITTEGTYDKTSLQ